MTLDLSGKQVDTDTPEVAAYKKTVVKVAQRVKRDMGWCESGYNKAMRDLGIAKAVEKIKVEVNFTVADVTETVVQRFPLPDLIGKSDEEQKAYVASKIAPQVSVAGKLLTLPVTVNDLNEAATQTGGGWYTLGETEIPTGYIGFFVGHEGRVIHLGAIPTLDRYRDAVDALPEELGNPITMRRWMRDWGNRCSSLCGEHSAYYAEPESSRNENRFCRRCEAHIDTTLTDPR